MEQATQAITPTALTETPEQSVDRASYEHAKTLADQIVGRVKVLPDSIETRRELGTDTYGIRLHYGTGLSAGRGVLETAAVTDADVIRDDIDRGGHVTGVWVELRTTFEGVPLIARALTTVEDADRLMPDSDCTTATQPIPTVGTSPSAVVVPAVIPVVPLPAMKATASESGK